jgi:hypothetical protein
MERINRGHSDDIRDSRMARSMLTWLCEGFDRVLGERGENLRDVLWARHTPSIGPTR